MKCIVSGRKYHGIKHRSRVGRDMFTGEAEYQFFLGSNIEIG